MTAAQTRTAPSAVGRAEGQTEILVRDSVNSSVAPAADSRHRLSCFLDIAINVGGIVLGMATGVFLAIGALR